MKARRRATLAAPRRWGRVALFHTIGWKILGRRRRLRYYSWAPSRFETIRPSRVRESDKMSDDFSYEEQCDLHEIGYLDMDRWY